MATDFAGKEILPGQFVVQAAASGHHKYLKVGVVLEVISNNEVRVQSETRPGIVTWVQSRLMVLPDESFVDEKRALQLKKIYEEWKLKNA